MFLHAIQQLQVILHTELILLQEILQLQGSSRAGLLPATVPRVSKHSTRQNKASGPTRAHYTTIQRILHPESNSTCRRQRALRVLQSSFQKFYAQKARRSSRNASVCFPGNSSCSNDISVVPDLPETFQTFQSFMTFQPSRQFYNVPVFPGNPPHSSILRLECIFYSSIGFQKTPPSTSWATTDITNIHSSKKGRCCDIGQIDRLFIIELFPLSSCQVIILIARMTFNCSTSCLMS